MSKNLLQSIKTILLALVLSAGVAFVSAAVWSPAPANPPAGNTPEPLNVGPSWQTKIGDSALTIGDLSAPYLDHWSNPGGRLVINSGILKIDLTCKNCADGTGRNAILINPSNDNSNATLIVGNKASGFAFWSTSNPCPDPGRPNEPCGADINARDGHFSRDAYYSGLKAGNKGLDHVCAKSGSGMLMLCAAAPDKYTLTVSVYGNGSVTSNDTFINCPTVACSHTYNSGDSVTLTATHGTGANFVPGWGGNCSGTNTTCTLNNITANKSVTATFTAAIQKPIVTTAIMFYGQPPGVMFGGTVVSTGGANVTATGVHFGTELCQESGSWVNCSINVNTAPQNFANPGDFSGIVKLSGYPFVNNAVYYYQAYATNSAGISYGQLRSFTYSGTSYSSPPGTYKIQVSTSGYGTVTGGSIYCGKTLRGTFTACSEDLNLGTPINLTWESDYKEFTSPLQRSAFEGWGGYCASTGMGNPCTLNFSATGTYNVSAPFTSIFY